MTHPPMTHPDVGKAIAEIDTPALLVELDALDHNIATMARAAAAAGADWRPHIKASKAPALAGRLIAGGAVGVTSAKVSEAEAMVDGGVNDILIANEIVGSTKIARLAQLARRARLCVVVDEAGNLRQIDAALAGVGATIDVLVDVNVNMDRCGVPPDQAPGLAQLVTDLPHVHLRGLMGYEGHVMHLDPEEKERETIAAADILQEARALVEAAGLKVGVTSGGGSGNYWITLAQGHLSELQAGGGVLFDRSYEQMGLRGHRFALLLLSQIISVPDESRAIGDAGWKATGRHTGLPLVHDREDIEVVSLNAEHTIYRLAPGVDVKPGDHITLIPSYSDSTVLLHRQLHAVRDGVVQEVWPVSGAGQLQ